MAAQDNLVGQPRPRGRPRIKPRVFGPKQKCGRPPKAPQVPTDVVDGLDEARPVKKARGRPKKSVPQQLVTVELGSFVSILF